MSSCKSTRFPSMVQPKRSKQYSPSKKAIYSPLAVEEDQKQIIVTKLKEEIKLLEKNKAELDSLKDHYKKLQHEYNHLLTQKKTNDNAFAKHHESALREICMMKNEIDTIKVNMRQNKLEIQDLNADQNTLQNELDQKQIDIEKLKNQLRSSIADNQQLAAEREKLSLIQTTVFQERQKRADECQKLKTQIDNVQSKIQQMTKYQTSLIKEETTLTQEIIKLEELNNNTDNQIATTCEDLSILDQKIQASQNHITDLQRKIVQSTALSQKYKTDGLYNKKSTQAQVIKNNDTYKNIVQAQTLLNVRVNQVKEGHRELEMLNQENISLEKINNQLEDDLEACKRHLENLALLNGELVKNMHAISEEDEEVRNLIDRKERIERADQRVQQVDQSRKGIQFGHQSTASSSRYNSRRRFY